MPLATGVGGAEGSSLGDAEGELLGSTDGEAEGDWLGVALGDGVGRGSGSNSLLAGPEQVVPDVSVASIKTSAEIWSGFPQRSTAVS